MWFKLRLYNAFCNSFQNWTYISLRLAISGTKRFCVSSFSFPFIYFPIRLFIECIYFSCFYPFHTFPNSSVFLFYHRIVQYPSTCSIYPNNMHPNKVFFPLYSFCWYWNVSNSTLKAISLSVHYNSYSTLHTNLSFELQLLWYHNNQYL